MAADGHDLDRLTPEDLARLDEFHIGGKEATLALAEWAGLEAGSRVLDVGCGIGGPARTLASQLGCRVMGVDVTEEYCQVAEQLTNLVAPDTEVRFRHADALELPVSKSSFDVVWTQHVAMNVFDKGSYFSNIRRALRPGGLFVLYEIMAGEFSPIHFPVPWASSSELSFLAPAAEWREAIRDAGFRRLGWEDVSSFGIRWFEERIAELEDPDFSLPNARLQMLFGEDGERKFRNVAKNLREDRIAVARGAWEAV